ELHALQRPKNVGRYRDVETGGILEQQRRSALLGLARTIGHSSDLECPAHAISDSYKLPSLVQIGKELGKVAIHRTKTSSRLSGSRARARVRRQIGRAH